jgi:hypothetical protein
MWARQQQQQQQTRQHLQQVVVSIVVLVIQRSLRLLNVLFLLTRLLPRVHSDLNPISMRIPPKRFVKNIDEESTTHVRLQPL